MPSATPVGPPASTFSAVPPQQTSGPILPAPGQTQAGVTRNCRRWDFVAAGVTCNTLLARYPGITLAQLVSWNPAIGSGCNTMWAEYYVSRACCFGEERELMGSRFVLLLKGRLSDSVSGWWRRWRGDCWMVGGEGDYVMM